MPSHPPSSYSRLCSRAQAVPYSEKKRSLSKATPALGLESWVRWLGSCPHQGVNNELQFTSTLCLLLGNWWEYGREDVYLAFSIMEVTPSPDQSAWSISWALTALAPSLSSSGLSLAVTPVRDLALSSQLPPGLHVLSSEYWHVQSLSSETRLPASKSH